MTAKDKLEMPSSFRIGDWTVNPASGLLIKDGEEIKIEPKVMEVLVHLVQNQGDVVSREFLEEKVWTGLVVGYDAVSTTIIKLRKALGDDAKNPKYIKTVSKRGYQLIAKVEADISQKDEVPETSHSVDKQSADNKKHLKLSVAVLSCAALLLLYLSGSNEGQNPDSNPSSIPAVLVLPFKNLSDDSKQEHLSNGFTDDLITDLSREKYLRVIARHSSYHYKQNPATITDIAQELRVLYIVEGSVRKLGSKIRINVQLTNTEQNESTWAQRYDTDTANIFSVQDEITQSITNAMLGGDSKQSTPAVATRSTNNFKAYDAFLTGLQHIERRNNLGYEMAMNAYQQAMELDPNYARVYGAMAVAVTRGYRYQWSDLSLVEGRERALELANRAVELNQPLPQIYWALAYVHLHRREYDAAEKAAKQSVKISPNYADGYALLANIANWRGKHKDALEYIETAMALNPHYSFQYPSTLGLAYYYLGNYESAVSQFNNALSRNVSALNPRLYLAASYARLNRADDAAWEIEQVNSNHANVILSTLDTILPFENKNKLAHLKDDLKKAGLSK